LFLKKEKKYLRTRKIRIKKLRPLLGQTGSNKYPTFLKPRLKYLLAKKFSYLSDVIGCLGGGRQLLHLPQDFGRLASGLGKP
jgi:hypothetical protein